MVLLLLLLLPHRERCAEAQERFLQRCFYQAVSNWHAGMHARQANCIVNSSICSGGLSCRYVCRCLIHTVACRCMQLEHLQTYLQLEPHEQMLCGTHRLTGTWQSACTSFAAYASCQTHQTTVAHAALVPGSTGRGVLQPSCCCHTVVLLLHV